MNLKRRWNAYQNRRRLKRFYAQFMRPGDVVFDAGANVGNRTRIFAELGARVIAIEPQKECVRQLYVQFHENSRVTIIPKALGAARGYLEMQLSNFTIASSFNLDLIDAERADPRRRKMQFNKTQSMPVTTLDALIAEYGAPSFIKLDIEGFEPEALKGLSRPPVTLSFEFLPIHLKPARECIAQLGQFGAIRYNYALDEHMKLLLKDWVGADEMLQILNSYEHAHEILYGDVYARLNR